VAAAEPEGELALVRESAGGVTTGDREAEHAAMNTISPAARAATARLPVTIGRIRSGCDPKLQA
jgi:hypothetical protein